MNIKLLVVAGGGGGGAVGTSAGSSGGGGAGGYYYNAAYVLAAGSYSVTVGGGGAGASVGYNTGTAGNNSVFDAITSHGGGGGGSALTDASTGGSGGGAGGTRTGAAGTGGEGNTGGNGNNGAGGGGGSNAVGAQGPANNQGGGGGNGTAIDITGSTVTYAGGGGGGGFSGAGSAGTGGGGNGGASAAGSDATANTGSGGGGASDSVSTGRKGGNGGSGIVVVAYLTSDIQGRTITGGTLTTSGSYTIRTFNSNDTLVLPAFSDTITSGSFALTGETVVDAYGRIDTYTSGVYTLTGETLNDVLTRIWGYATKDTSAFTNPSKTPSPSVRLQSLHQYVATSGTGYAFNSNNTAGNFIAVFVSGDGSAGSSVITVTDSQSNAYTPLTLNYTSGGATSQMFYAPNIKGGANSVTVTATNLTDIGFTAVEYSGIALSSPLDVEATPFKGSTTTRTPTSNSFNPKAGSLIFAGYANEGTNPGTTTGTGVTVFQTDQTHYDVEGDNLLATTGAQTVKFNLTNLSGIGVTYNVNVASFLNQSLLPWTNATKDSTTFTGNTKH